MRKFIRQLRADHGSAGPLASLHPVSDAFIPADTPFDASQAYVLSRFAYTRRDSDRMVLECPLAHARIVLHDARAAAALHVLTTPARLAEIAAAAGLSDEVVRAFLTLLLQAGMLTPASSEASPTQESEPEALRSWEFHDLVFHTRSRQGRHDQPVGGTYRFAGLLDPPPVLKSARYENTIPLPHPDLDRIEHTDPPLAQVQEKRRSIRTYGEPPISAEQLGEFLYRVGRIVDVWEMPLPGDTGRMTFAPRPYPSGGALYELELYAVVNRCDGVPPGLYHYDPEQHRLGRLASMNDSVAQLLADAAWGSGIKTPGSIQVLIVVASRFQRIAWKYASIAYALTLKHVGVLYQTMYLSATAMGLAPCALGTGNADLFARAAGTDYFAETSVGEFLLGTRGA